MSKVHSNINEFFTMKPQSWSFSSPGPASDQPVGMYILKASEWRFRREGLFLEH